MENMFHNCMSLNNLDLISFNTPNIINIQGLFSGCSSLALLDMSNFNTSITKDISEAFNGINKQGKITYNSTLLTNNIINLIPQEWEKNDITKNN